MARRSAAGDAYVQRINAVMDHIRANVAGDLSLDALARIACFSPYHFHRIFSSIAGETLHAFVRRARVERAAALLRSRPGAPVTRVAFECGFSSLSDLSRSFKAHYGVSPGRWDRRGPLEERKKRQADDPCRRYSDAEVEALAATGRFEARIRDMPAQHVAYIRIVDSYAADNVLRGYERLIAWLRRRFGGLPPGTLIGMSHDDPDVTAPEKCRYDFCYTVPADVRGKGEISVRTLPACRIAGVHCDGGIDDLVGVWEYLYRWWLPRSAWQPSHLPAMEVYRRTPEEVGWEWFDLDACVPIEPLGAIGWPGE